MVWISRRHGLVALSGLSWLAGHGLAEESQASDAPVSNIAIIGSSLSPRAVQLHRSR